MHLLISFPGCSSKLFKENKNVNQKYHYNKYHGKWNKCNHHIESDITTIEIGIESDINKIESDIDISTIVSDINKI